MSANDPKRPLKILQKYCDKHKEMNSINRYIAIRTRIN